MSFLTSLKWHEMPNFRNIRPFCGMNKTSSNKILVASNSLHISIDVIIYSYSSEMMISSVFCIDISTIVAFKL